jgi:nuclease S1
MRLPSQSSRQHTNGFTRRARARWHVLVLAVAAASPLNAEAWGGEAHRLIAELAETRLTDAARAEVNRLLAQEPGATLVSISTWADEFRSPSTAAWHYVNLPRDSGCRYASQQSCVQGKCVVGAVERQVEVLASAQPDEERLRALKYVTHLVPDAHQPLHAGFADDRGGNNYQLQAFGRGTNLHAVWDSALIRNWPGGEQALRTAVKTEMARSVAHGTAAVWVEESCSIVLAPGFYPDGRQLGADYQDRWATTLERQLAIAAQRLATVLNQALPER